MKKKLFLVFTLVAFVLSFATAFAAVDKTPGVPKGAVIVYTIALTAEHRASLAKYGDMVLKNPEFDKMAANFEKETGTAFPKGVFTLAGKATNVSFGVVPDAKNPTDAPNIGVFVTFDNDKTPVELVGKAKEKMTQMAKKEKKIDIAFKDGEEDGLKVSSASIKEKNTFKIYVSGNTLALCFVNESDPAASKAFTAALKSDKETVMENDKFKEACKKAGSETSIFYAGSEFFRILETREKKNETEFINYIALGGAVSGDLASIKSSFIMSMTEPKDEKAKKAFEMAKNLLGAVKRTGHPADAMPADTLVFVDLSLGLTKKFFELPEMAQVAPAIMMAGMNLEADVLSWLDGTIYAAVCDIADVKAIVADKKVPDLFIGLGSKDAAKSMAFLEKLLAFAKNTGMPYEFKDETVGGVKVKAAEIKGVPAQGVYITAGNVGNYLVIASTKGAFEKAAQAVAKKETSLSANANFKKVFEADPASFVSFFMDFDKLKKIVVAASPVKDDKVKQLEGMGMERMAVSAGFSGTEIKGSFAMTMDMSKITPEFIAEQIRTAMKMKGKAEGAAPAVDEKKPEEKKDAPAVEEKKETEGASVDQPKGAVEKVEEKGEENVDQPKAEKTDN